jgi:hypothetical protein
MELSAIPSPGRGTARRDMSRETTDFESLAFT